MGRKELNSKMLMGVLGVLKNQIENMGKTLNKAEKGNVKMLPIWFSVIYYQADQIKLAIEFCLKQQAEHNIDIGQTMAELQRKAFEMRGGYGQKETEAQDQEAEEKG